MGNLVPLVLGLASADIKSAVRRARILAAFYTIAALLGGAGFTALLISAGMAMARHMEPEAAALSIAGILIALSVTVLAASSIWLARERNKRASKSAGRTIAAALAVSILPVLFSNRLGVGIIAAAAGGYALANRKVVKPAAEK